jgi:hypothetical protein
VIVLSSAADSQNTNRRPSTPFLAAHAGYLLGGGLAPSPPGLEAIAEAKLRLGRGALDWLRRRLTKCGSAGDHRGGSIPFG